MGGVGRRWTLRLVPRPRDPRCCRPRPASTALLKDAPVLVLDEATSAVDTFSERLIQEALERNRAGRTTLVVAHRLATVRNADRIFVLENGRIVESGTHHEMIASRGRYFRLVQNQVEPVAVAAGV